MYYMYASAYKISVRTNPLSGLYHRTTTPGPKLIYHVVSLI